MSGIVFENGETCPKCVFWYLLVLANISILPLTAMGLRFMGIETNWWFVPALWIISLGSWFFFVYQKEKEWR